ncbi:MAG: HAD family phosphatase [Ignavibacteriales bacterium]|nr:HAD family phosphatase [Ignavibacteriales bacterium]
MIQFKYSVVVFDLGNVLIPFDYSIMIARLDAIKPDLGKRFTQFYKDNYHIHRSFEKGEINEKDFLSKMNVACEGAVDEITFCKIFSEIFTLNQDVISLLPKLKMNYKLVLLSNTNSIHREFGYKQYEFFKHFDKLFLSHEVGAIKPEPEIYKAVERFTQVPSAEHIFIDDVKEYVDGAKAIGWDGIQFQNYNQLVTELKKRNINF